MCGIVGIIGLKGKETVEGENLHRMTATLSHRGPDDEGYLLVTQGACRTFIGPDTPKSDPAITPNYNSQIFIEEGYKVPSTVAFGHRRLAILDLSLNGHQPMSYLNRYWIVFNGEIYNYIELRQELMEYGYKFCSQSDTEVLMAAYDKWGPECLQRFNGMWAFAIYDVKEERLFISRDRFGVKPLAYYFDSQVFIFASEIKALIKHRRVSTEPNLTYIKRFLEHHPVDYQEETAFKNIFYFPRASYVEFRPSDPNLQNLVPKTYWTVDVNLSNDEYDEAKARELAFEYLNLLEDAVRLRLRSDVRVGSAFSGGIDSSTITYLVNGLLNREGETEQQNVFSIVFKSSDAVRHCDESEFIDLLIGKLGLNSHQIEPSSDMVRREYSRMIYAMDTPQDHSLMSCWFTYWLARSAEVTVTLDGQGADELQGGYLRYLVNYFANLPLIKLRSEFNSFKHIPSAKKEILLGIIFNIIGKMFLKKGAEVVLRVLGKYSSPYMMVNMRLYQDFCENLVNLLHFGDRSSMAHSVETRYPFMDYRLVDFWFALPPTYKFRNGWTKYLARKAVSGRLPDSISWRKDKMGWELPEDYWFRGDLREWLIEKVEKSILLKDLGIYDDARLLLAENTSSKKLKRAIKLLNLAIWHEVFFNNPQIIN
jgi:asparagine synthase (glutamine-hydrolysing)